MQEIKITYQTPNGVDKINHFDLCSDFENDNLINVVLVPEGKTSAEPENWSIECNSIDGDWLNTYQYDSKSEYEQDVALLETFATQILKGNDYAFNAIEKWAEINDYTIECHGKDIIGEHFIVLKNDKDQTISFIYTSWNQAKGGFYTCIYSDLK